MVTSYYIIFFKFRLNISRLFIILFKATKQPIRPSDRYQPSSASVHGCIKTYLHVFRPLHSTLPKLVRGDDYILRRCTVGKHDNDVKLGQKAECCWGNRLEPTSPQRTRGSAVTPLLRIRALTPIVSALGVCHPPTHTHALFTHLVSENHMKK